MGLVGDIMTFRELVDMKKTFENVNKVRLIISEVNTEYANFDRIFFNLFTECLNPKGSEIGISMEPILIAYEGIIRDSYSKYKIVNKNSIKYDSLGDGFVLMSTDIDTILNVIGDVDINKNNEYAVFWHEQGNLRCIVDYKLMSRDKQKVVDDLVCKYYTKMNEIYTEKHTDRVKVDFTSLQYLFDVVLSFTVGLVILTGLNFLNMPNALEYAIISTSLMVLIVTIIYNETFKHKQSLWRDHEFELFKEMIHPRKRKIR